MTYFYIAGGFAAWGLGCLAVYSLAVAAGKQRPTATWDVGKATESPETPIDRALPAQLARRSA